MGKLKVADKVNKREKFMKVIGLTGGIGSGKSTVSDYLKAKDYLVIDADQIAREITEPGGKILIRLTETFGEEFLDEKGNLKRQELGNFIFGDKKREKQLNDITHEEIINEIKIKLYKAFDEGIEVVFLDIPLLFEVGMDAWCDDTWLTTCDEEIRIKRIMQRDGIEEKQVRERIESQMNDEKKHAKAGQILYNSGSKEELYKRIQELLSEI